MAELLRILFSFVPNIESLHPWNIPIMASALVFHALFLTLHAWIWLYIQYARVVIGNEMVFHKSNQLFRLEHSINRFYIQLHSLKVWKGNIWKNNGTIQSTRCENFCWLLIISNSLSAFYWGFVCALYTLYCVPNTLNITW